MAVSSKSLRIVERVRLFPGETEIQIAKALFGVGAVQQQVNAEVRRLVAMGAIRRDAATSPYRYFLGEGIPVQAPEPPSPVAVDPGAPLTEDAIKIALRNALERDGWRAEVKMGHERGIDIEARRGSERWIIEVKGPGSLQPMRVNYFLAILGETLQRMDDPEARYSIALPDLPQFRGLWSRLPALAKRRTTIDAIFVAPDGSLDFTA